MCIHNIQYVYVELLYLHLLTPECTDFLEITTCWEPCGPGALERQYTGHVTHIN